MPRTSAAPLSEAQIDTIIAKAAEVGVYATPVFEADGRIVEFAIFANGSLAGTAARAPGGGIAVWTEFRRCRAEDPNEAVRLIAAWSDRLNKPKKPQAKPKTCRPPVWPKLSPSRVGEEEGGELGDDTPALRTPAGALV